jgi:hypothetical protein
VVVDGNYNSVKLLKVEEVDLIADVCNCGLYELESAALHDADVT